MTVKRKNIVANFEARSVALVASWTLAGAALAQSAPPPPPGRDGRAVSTLFQQADRNGDGQIGHRGSVHPRRQSARPEEFDQGTKG